MHSDARDWRAGWWAEFGDEGKLDDREYTTNLLYDALNRVRKCIYPEDVDTERKELVPTYNRAGALRAIQMDGADHVRHIAYNAKGQRILLARGNHPSGPEFGMMTRYAYDPITYRLVRIRTEKYKLFDTEYEPQSGTTQQDSGYEYDLGGNIIKIKERLSDCGVHGEPLGDDALDRLFSYDPLKRLLEATGRESDTQTNSDFWDEKPICGTPYSKSTKVYTREYDYDKLGNILKLSHSAIDNNYNRFYHYEDGLNRLEQIDDGDDPPEVYCTFAYDDVGNVVQANTERYYEWDAADQLKYFKIDAGGGPSVEAHYLYAGGQRIKKFARDGSGNVEVTVYIDGVHEHRYRKNSGGTLTDEQTQQHLMDGRSCLFTVRQGDSMGDPSPLGKYMVEDHLGTITIRLNASGTVIDREEYYPFGESSLRTFSTKRYRYVGKELDSESGLYYYGARYYAAWVGRFISVDPLADSYAHLNPYNYANNSPIVSLDFDGLNDPSVPTTPNSSGSHSSGGTEPSANSAINKKDIPVQSDPKMSWWGKLKTVARAFAPAALKTLAWVGIGIMVVIAAPIVLGAAVGGAVATAVVWGGAAVGSYIIAEGLTKILTSREPFTGRKLSEQEYYENVGDFLGNLAGGVGGLRTRGFFERGAPEPSLGSKQPTPKVRRNEGEKEASDSVSGRIVNKTKYPLRRALSEEEMRDIQKIANRFNVVIDVVGSRARGRGRWVDDPSVPKGKEPHERSDIDFRFDHTHPQAAEIAKALRGVGRDAGSASHTKLDWSTAHRATYPPYIRFKPRVQKVEF